MNDTTSPQSVRRSTVLSKGAALAVYERNEPTADNQTLVMVHGWPDTHAVWDLVADRIAASGHHVVTFDVRGVGASTAAPVPRPYLLTHMAADITSVIEAVSPDRRVHLVGHDWGGVEGWERVAEPDAAGRVATFTTVSGPNLDHLGRVMRSHPVDAVIQGAKSLYTLTLSTPVVRTAIWRLGFGRLFRIWLRVTEGIRPEDGSPGPDLAEAAIAAVPLYRSNIFGRMRRPNPRMVRVPVHQLVATKDRYVSARVLARSEQWVEDFTRTEIPAGHWSPRTHDADVAAHIIRYVEQRSTEPAARGEVRS